MHLILSGPAPSGSSFGTPRPVRWQALEQTKPHIISTVFGTLAQSVPRYSPCAAPLAHRRQSAFAVWFLGRSVPG
eukprot:1164565-Rhodomonas_salina.1